MARGNNIFNTFELIHVHPIVRGALSILTFILNC